MMQAPDHIPDVRTMVPEQTLTVPDVLAESWNAARALAFRAGAEAMREAAAKALELDCTGDFGQCKELHCFCAMSLSELSSAILDLPLPETAA